MGTASVRRWDRFIGVWLGWLLLTTSLITAGVWKAPTHRAVLLMAWGLILLWVVGFGAISMRFGPRIAQWVRSWPLPWMVRFVVACTLLAMLEEVVTTSMTNLAPLMGVSVGDAYITASANYLDVVVFHSVSVFVSFFVAWAIILRFVRFSPWQAFFLFGITGLIAETLYGGLQQLPAFAMWIPVYGWMIYIPALSVEPPPTAREPRWWMFPVAVFFPYPFMLLFPLNAVLQTLSPVQPHPSQHFPPIH